MTRKLAVVVVVLAALALAPAAAAAEPAAAEVTTSGDGAILWVDAAVTSPDAAKVQVKILAPGEHRRVLFQRCRFA